MKKIIEMYEQGCLTENTALYEIFDFATLSDLGEMPVEWLKKLREYVDSLPTTDDGWGKFMVVQSWCNCGPAKVPTMDELREFNKKRTQFFRDFFYGEIL
jgi:hypothetical protein